MTLKHAANSNMNNQQMGSCSEPDKNEKYRLLTLILEKKIIKIRSVMILNRRFGSFRSLAVKKLIKKRTKDVELLKTKLDVYNDNWRN
jgi:hypothetical protein